jgi:y4mF family transcriptional regulator
MTTITSTQDLGAKIRAARKQLGLTQSDLALAAGVGLRFVVDLERGKSTVQLAKTLQVIHSLGGVIEITGLDTGETEKPRTKRAKQNSAGKNDRRILNEILEMTSDLEAHGALSKLDAVKIRKLCETSTKSE